MAMALLNGIRKEDFKESLKLSRSAPLHLENSDKPNFIRSIYLVGANERLSGNCKEGVENI